MKNWINTLQPTKTSFILPTYNRFTYFSACLDSIKNLCPVINYDCEVVVVNDGSTDKSKEEYESVIERIIDEGLNVSYIHLGENSGTVSVARNIAISYATGRIIAPTDDDCFPTIAKAHMIKSFIFRNENSPLFLFGDREEWALNDDGDHNYIKTVNCAEHAQNKGRVGIDNGQFIYDAVIYEKVPPVFAINACDWELYRRISQYTEFQHWPHPVCQYIWHTNNISRTPKEKRVNPLSVLPQFLKYFKNNEFKDFCQSIINT